MIKLPIYRPGEVDEEVYAAPQKPLPPWRSDSQKDQEAFLQWAMDALDEFDPPGLPDALERMESDFAVRMLLEEFERPIFDRLRREWLPHLTWKAFRDARYGPMAKRPRETPGPKGNERIEAAAADDAHLTALFKRCYNGKFRRTKPPSREDILCKRYGLTHDEWDKVSAKIKKARRPR